MNARVTLWIPLFSAPAIWFASFLAGFAVAPLACAQHSNALLWLISAVALALDGASGFVAWREWQRAKGSLAIAGMILSAGFFIVIGAQAIPTLMLAGCQ